MLFFFYNSKILHLELIVTFIFIILHFYLYNSYWKTQYPTRKIINIIHGRLISICFIYYYFFWVYINVELYYYGKWVMLTRDDNGEGREWISILVPVLVLVPVSVGDINPRLCPVLVAGIKNNPHPLFVKENPLSIFFLFPREKISSPYS